jgi:molybdopterin-guanine dinucleotide biosynthesis protein B
VKIFSITGWSRSGKTTLIKQLIKHFKLNNKKVVVVKGAPHKYYVEPEATDTFKFLEAGADEVCMAAAKEMMTMRSITSKQEVFDFLETRYADCDILLMEGLRRDDIPLIEVFDSTQNQTLKSPIEALIAVVSDKPVTRAIPNFNRDDIAEITRFMEDYNG